MEEAKPRSPRASGAVPTQPRGIEQIIKAAVDRGASDLHIKAGDVFRARIDGKLVPLTKQRLTPEQTKAIALRLIPNEEDQAKIDRIRDYDCSWGMPGLGRFRVNILRQRSSFMIVMRVIPFDVPSFESLQLPSVLRAAEPGQLVISTLDRPDAVTPVARVIAMHPAEEQDALRLRLSESLQAVVSQRLLPRADGRGRVAAVEVLICSGAAREMIRDARRMPDLHAYIRISRERLGSQTLDQHLFDLVAEGVVTHEAAIAAAPVPAEFEQMIRGLDRRPPPARPAETAAAREAP